MQTIRTVTVRYSRPEPEEKKRLRRLVAQLHARAILRATADGSGRELPPEQERKDAGQIPSKKP